MEDENVAIFLCLIIFASIALRIQRDRRRPRQWMRASIYRKQFGAHHALMEKLASEDPHSFRIFYTNGQTRLRRTSYESNSIYSETGYKHA